MTRKHERRAGIRPAFFRWGSVGVAAATALVLGAAPAVAEDGQYQANQYQANQYQANQYQANQYQALFAQLGLRAARTQAVAVNYHDGSIRQQVRVGVVSAAGPTVDTSNLALAYGRCTGCTTEAVSVQILLVQGSPTTYQPRNIALALNNSCTSCNTFADAQQIAFQVAPTSRLDEAGREAVRSAQSAIEAVLQSDPAGSALTADSLMDTQIATIVAQLRTTLGSDFTGPAQQDGHQQEQQAEVS